MGQPSNDYGCSYKDVAKWADEFERDWHCHTHFEWWAAEVRGKGLVWSIRLVARWKGTGAAVTHERGWSKEWPNVDSKTPAGTMMLLLWNADDVLEEEKQEAEERSGQLALFGQN